MTAWTAVRDALLVLAAAPFAYYLLAIFAARRFFAARPDDAPDFTPPVSILKPIHGLDRETYENYASFCRQDYAQFEILFCVTDNADPAIPVIEKIIRDFPGRPIRLLVGSEPVGASDKVSKLCRMAREARHDFLIVSDSDVRVEPGFLRAVVAPFRDSRVGGVTCLYRGLTDGSFAAGLEALGNSTDFAPGVLVAWQLGDGKLDFMLGAVMATTKKYLAEIGGFESLADFFSRRLRAGQPHRCARPSHRALALSRGHRLPPRNARRRLSPSVALESQHPLFAPLGPSRPPLHPRACVVSPGHAPCAIVARGFRIHGRILLVALRNGARRRRARYARSARAAQLVDVAAARCLCLRRLARQLFPPAHPLARPPIPRPR